MPGCAAKKDEVHKIRGIVGRGKSVAGLELFPEIGVNS